MAKLPDKFEDWTPPWDEDDFDADKAARRVFNTEKKLETAKARNAELDTELNEAKTKLVAAESANSGKNDSEKDAQIATLSQKVQELEAKGRPEDQRTIERLQVANDYGLSAKDAARLVGDDREALEEDAKDLAKRLGISKEDEGENEGNQGGDPSLTPRLDPRSTVVPQGRKNGSGGSVPTVLSPEQLLAQSALDTRTLLPQR